MKKLILAQASAMMAMAMVSADLFPHLNYRCDRDSRSPIPKDYGRRKKIKCKKTKKKRRNK